MATLSEIKAALAEAGFITDQREPGDDRLVAFVNLGATPDEAVAAFARAFGHTHPSDEELYEGYTASHYELVNKAVRIFRDSKGLGGGSHTGGGGTPTGPIPPAPAPASGPTWELLTYESIAAITDTAELAAVVALIFDAVRSSQPQGGPGIG